MADSISSTARTIEQIEHPKIQTLGDIPAVHAAACPDRVAQIYGHQATSYKQLEKRSNQIAHALLESGLKHGDRVAFLDRNSDRFFPILFGVLKAGLTLVPVNFRLAPAELSYILSDSEAGLIFAGKDYEAAIQESGIAVKTIIIDHATGLDEWTEGFSDTPPSADIQPEAIALQMYTSGTTGAPKGVMLSHRAMIRSAIEGLSVWPAMFRTGAGVLATMPLFHIAACNLGLAGLYAGARVVIIRETTTAELADLIVDQNITVTPLPAALIHEICKLPDIEEMDFSQLDTLLIAGSGIQVELLREAQAKLGCGFALSYGMTECCGGLTYLGPEDCTYDAGQKLESAGRPFGKSEIRIVDETGADLASGDVGEILCRTDRVMTGYWNMPDATNDALKNGWYHSGDAGYLDDKGYLYVVDRIKDMVISGGENIYPAEVEAALASHPDVDDVAVIGVPDEKWGERLVACIILKKDQPSADEFISYLRPHLAGYKIPRQYEVIDAFPRNATGKVLKRDLRKTYSAD